MSTPPPVYSEITQLCSYVVVSSICRRLRLKSACKSGFPNGSPLPGSVFPRVQLHLMSSNLLLVHVQYIYTQDFQLRVHPDPLHLLLCAYGGSRSARVQVAHGSEWWPGSRLAAPVSIWCWQFTQAFFSTAPGRINTLFPFSEGSISRPQG